MWKGAAATLKPRPTIMSAVAAIAKRPGLLPSAGPIFNMLVEPVAPNMSATPYRKNAVANDPSRKYLTEDSLLIAERRRRIKPERCDELLELLASLPIETQDESDRLRGPVLRLARAHRLSVYDAVYLDLAMDRGLSLATHDVTLRKTARAEGVSLIET